MRVESAEKKIGQYEREIRSYIYDSFVWRHIAEPIIDEDKLAVFLAILSHSDVEEQSLTNYILSIMLMQIALDTHENVTNDMNKEDSLELKKRQLTILAGDYYSGLYYHILARTEDVCFIKEFSQGIQAINESKVELYKSKEASAAFLFSHMESIETALAEKTAAYFGRECNMPFFKDFLLLKRVNREFALLESLEYRQQKVPSYYSAMLLPPFLNGVEDIQNRMEQGLQSVDCEDMAERARKVLAESRGHINNMMGKGLFG